MVVGIALSRTRRNVLTIPNPELLMMLLVKNGILCLNGQNPGSPCPWRIGSELSQVPAEAAADERAQEERAHQPVDQVE